MTTNFADGQSVRVETLSARTELLVVIRAGMAVAVGIWIYVAFAAGVGGGTPERNLLPFQKLAADRPPGEQRMFRELQEGLIEAEAVRSASSRWPSAEQLSAGGIPPFALDPTNRSKYDWNVLRGGMITNYLGVPRAGGSRWLVLVQEPEPGVPPDQTFEDEEHHRLANGTMIHVSTWVHDGPPPPDRLVRVPQSEGWTQLYAVGPSRRPAAPSTRP